MVFGVDVGDASCVVSVPKAGGITVLNNEVSKRETSSTISFGEKERFIGESAVDHGIRNWKNTATHIKRLVGIDLSSNAAQYERRFVKNEMRADANGRIEIKVHYKYDEHWFKPEQLLAALLTQMRIYPELEAGDGKHRVVDPDCVASVPVYYTALQRQLAIQAFQIAGLNTLTIMNENTATALDYGIHKSGLLPEKEDEALHVAFVDLGNSASTITIVQFVKGQLKVLGHVWDKYMGCRDFDAALFDEFAKMTEAKYKFDINSEKKAALKLLSSCDKLKKVLSANPLGVLSCELPECDISFQYTRERAEEVWKPLLERMGALVQRAKSIPGFDKVTTVELVGGGSRIPILKQIISEAFAGIPLSTTLHATESASKGCAIMAAMLSPKFKVRDFMVIDCNSFPVSLGYHSEKSNAHPYPQYPMITKQIPLLKSANECPKTLNLTFDRSTDFELFAFYNENDEVSDSHENRMLGKWIISGIPVLNDPHVKVRVRFSPSMLVSVEGATVSYEEEVDVEVEVEVPPEAVENGEEETPQPPKKVKQVEKRTTLKVLDCKVQQVLSLGNTLEDVQKMRDQESLMIESDNHLHSTQEAKNAVEAYIYETRGKLSEGGVWFSSSTKQEREHFNSTAATAEEWLYGEGADTSKEDYEMKLAELKTSTYPIVTRREEEERLKKEQEQIQREDQARGQSERKRKAAESRERIEDSHNEEDTQQKGMDLD